MTDQRTYLLFRTVAIFAAAGVLFSLLMFFVSGVGPFDVKTGKTAFAVYPWEVNFLLIVAATSFCITLLVFGRSELALISLVPLLAGWYVFSGIIQLSGAERGNYLLFEAPLLFGPGTGYHLYLIRRLVNSYRAGETAPKAFPANLFYMLLSVLFMLCLLAVEGHPVFSAGTLLTVAGIPVILAFSGWLVQWLFNKLVYDNKNSRVEPVTLTSFLVSTTAFSMFLAGSLLLTLIIPVLIVVPAGRDRTRYFFHQLLSFTLRIVVYSIFPIRKVIEVRNKLDFSKPSVIVCNHQSHLDLAIILMLNPRIIVLTNKWVWNNPFYGFVVRFAGFYPIFRGVDQHLAGRLGKMVAKGYSVLVFPEGTRTNDGRINRFHQGAFWLADKLNIEIQPLLLHGANHCMIKKEFFLRPGVITLRALNRIRVESVGEDESYRLQAQALCRLYRKEFEKMSMELETPEYFRNRLLSQFLYKGPVIEWYARVKVSLEKNYDRFNRMIPRDATVVDIGCGYGFLSHMLCLVSDKRQILGLDYDSAKIMVAGRIGTSLKSVRFEVADVLDYNLPRADVFILLDVLHYLPPGCHEILIEKCIRNLNNNGIIIIRDADTDLGKRMWRTRSNEFFSTRFFRFNKTRTESLSFISGTMIGELATKHNFIVQRDDNTTKKADITFILKQAER